MLYRDQYAALSHDHPDYASDGEHEQYPLTEDGRQPTPPARPGHSRRYRWVVVAVLAQVVYTVLVLVVVRQFYYKRVCVSLAAPDSLGAWKVLKYSEVDADHREPDEHHPFLGAPGPSVDRNWHELLSTFRDRLPSAEIKRLGIEEGSIWLDDDLGGYYGSVWVGHNLHCVKYIYDGLHRDHYYPNLTVAEETSHQRHLHHCLHRLMDALKCHPDMSPITQHWVVNEVVPVVNWDGARHTCANWDHVVDWAKKNRIVPAGKASIPEVAPHPLYAKFINERGKADFVNKDAIIEWDLLWARPDWQEFARERGIPEGTIPPKEMLRNKHVG
ncbi:hypothetical protein MGG_03425 [Pyricularia oryzae 70-15]|uniref:Tat pathway signal sequence n=1 Tax=Pyricularia oryzae (strain 70-15 / ATCC MYA-4617 / FGSC 8958) TaxID=242507 RepID=G4N8J7_PYRO7|nr:uncharacterized protein MGG_03425 [Pyricularia oryzae 70-15]EHA50191.1 hypothetical protein MGG_03425 [Pyricularia oryzae 70-15]KAI7921063.1 hypothetical protein M0657_006241 [Pyricularia oryzae]KAI7921179.1 hypothetical protein M9X92_005589 [Pyricularia oryzae]